MHYGSNARAGFFKDVLSINKNCKALQWKDAEIGMIKDIKQI